MRAYEVTIRLCVVQTDNNDPSKDFQKLLNEVTAHATKVLGEHHSRAAYKVKWEYARIPITEVN